MRQDSGFRWPIVLTGMVLGSLTLLAAADVPITVRTTDCNGQVGMASFDVERLYTIQADDCSDPNRTSPRCTTSTVTATLPTCAWS